MVADQHNPRDPREWHSTIDLAAETFDGLRLIAAEALREVLGAKNYRAIELAAGGNLAFIPGTRGNSPYYMIKTECPVKLRVAELRKEADALEATLGEKRIGHEEAKSWT
jgi:hypothetical protein